MVTKLQKGAKIAIEQCLEIDSKDTVAIITDKMTVEIGDALEAAVLNTTAKLKRFFIEDFTKRPAKELPTKLVTALLDFRPNVSIYAAHGQEGELSKFRQPLVALLYHTLSCRHAHMIGITRELMEDGLNKNYALVFKITNRIHDLVKDADKITVEDAYGTNITFTLAPHKLIWSPNHGKIKPNEPWQNLPAGEVFTCPKSVDGKFVAFILGDYFSEKFGVLKNPIVIEIANGLVTKAYLKSKTKDPKSEKALREFEEYISQEKFGNRVGELGIGTLVGLKKFVGNLLQDEKFPGVHIAFGNPLPEQTKADWKCGTHLDVIAKNVTITVYRKDVKTIIMNKGKYINKLLK